VKLTNFHVIVINYIHMQLIPTLPWMQ